MQLSRSVWRYRLVFGVIALSLWGCKETPPSSPPEHAGQIVHAAATETSGIAASHRTKDVLWVHNDSAGQPVLYAIGTDGRLRGSVRVAGVKNIDWEDIASFDLDGQAWLLIADTGDNNGTRKNCSLYVIAEPDAAGLSLARELTATVAWRIPVVYPEGAHDCEAVAVDAKEETVFLLTKRTQPATVYSLPLRPAADGKTRPAEPIARLTGVPKTNARQKILPTPTGRYRAQATAMDISPDRTTAAVLTYGDVLLFPRRPGEPWSSVFSRAPEILAPHGLTQAEAICFSQDSRNLYVTGERKNQPLLRYKLPTRATE
jgi:hypothetical protein